MHARVLLTVNEALAALGISRGKFYSEARAGRIKIRKIGAKTVISAEDLRSYVDNLPLAELDK